MAGTDKNKRTSGTDGQPTKKPLTESTREVSKTSRTLPTHEVPTSGQGGKKGSSGKKDSD